VFLGFGTDFLGPLERRQCTEFKLRSQVFTNFEVLQQATLNNAKLLGAERILGKIRVGAFADLLIVDGNPLEDLSVLDFTENEPEMIFRSGKVVSQ